MRGLPSILSLFRNEFNEFNNTRARMLDSIYHMIKAHFCCKNTLYEGCSNMNASSFITFFTYMLRQNSKRFYKGLYVTFKLAPNRKKYTVYLSSYSSLNEGHVSILTNSML